MVEKNKKRLSQQEALDLGLTLRPSGEYFLAGILFRALADELEVTYLNENTHKPDISSITKVPVEVHIQGREYAVRADNNELVIEELVPIVGL